MDKKKAIRLIEDAGICVSGYERNGCKDLLQMATQRLHDALAELRKPSWVSVRDALPPFGQSVLVCSESDPSDMWFSHRADRKDVVTDGDGWCNYPPQPGITHWQAVPPLPPPQKAQPGTARIGEARVCVSTPPSMFAPILSALSQSYRRLDAASAQYSSRSSGLFRKLGSYNDGQLYAIVGLKPGDRVLYKEQNYIVESVSMSYDAIDPAHRTDIEVWLHCPSNQWLKTAVIFPSDKTVIKLID